MGIRINPSKLRQFGPGDNCSFIVVTDEDYREKIQIVSGKAYRDRKVLTMSSTEDFREMLRSEAIPRRAHVLVIAPGVFFESPDPSDLGTERKLIAMACNSTPTSEADLQHFLHVMEHTDPAQQDAMADAFFESAEGSQVLRLVNREYGTSAEFLHRSENYVWNEQVGSLDWGAQQIAPAGEISALPMSIYDFKADRGLNISGQIVMKGQPVLHSGTPSFTRRDQARIYDRLSAMKHHGIVADVDCGTIKALHETDPAVRPAVRMLEALFDVDSRYRLLWELGFGVNTALTLLPSNTAMNEVYGGTHGSIHWGLGLTPYTQFHLDIISPDTVVLDDKERPIFGGRRDEKTPRLNRRNAACPCSSMAPSGRDSGRLPKRQELE